MKLYVICQICGRSGKVDTCRDKGWIDFKTNEAINYLKDYLDYDIWVCRECKEGKYDSLFEASFWEDLLQVEKSEINHESR